MLDEEPELLPPHKSAWPQLTPAACFRTFVLSQLLWTGKFEHRSKAAQLCLYGWDIALLPDASARERQIDRLWETCEPLSAKDLSPDFVRGFKQQMRALVALKRELLPTVRTLIMNANLEAVDAGTDRLAVTTDGGSVEYFSLSWRPDPAGTPSFGQRLNRLHQDTDDLADWLFDRLRQRRLSLEDAQEVAVLCGVRRVELAGYRELFAHWQGNHQGASIKRVTGHWLSMVDEIDSEIREILVALE